MSTTKANKVKKAQKECEDAICAANDALTLLRAANSRSKRVASAAGRKTHSQKVETLNAREDSGIHAT